MRRPFHADEAELLSIRLRNVVRRHFRVGPAEHGHHLALGAVGLSRNLGAGLAHAEHGEAVRGADAQGRQLCL
jgi:hypothetical protein